MNLGTSSAAWLNQGSKAVEQWPHSGARMETGEPVYQPAPLRFFAVLTSGSNPKRVLWGKGGGGKFDDIAVFDR